MPTISVIVPVYNTEKYLRRCVDSILAQTYTDFELLLVDDGSTDESGAICDEYAAKDARVLVFHQENQGQAAARNRALDWMFANSDSEYISFVDSDDWVHEKYLELLFQSCLNQETDVSFCDMYMTKDEIPANQDLLGVLPVQKPPEFIYTHGEKAIYTYVWGGLYNRKLWEDIRFPQGKRWEDLRIFHKVIFKAPTVSFLSEKLYYYYVNPEGTVFSPWEPRKLDYIEALKLLLNDPDIVSRNSIFTIIQYKYVEKIVHTIVFLSNNKTGFAYPVQGYIRTLRRDLRKALFLYRNEKDYSFQNRKWWYEVAYPKLMYIYWVMIGIRSKLKRVFGKLCHR